MRVGDDFEGVQRLVGLRRDRRKGLHADNPTARRDLEFGGSVEPEDRARRC